MIILLKELYNGTNGDTCIKGTRCVRAVIQALQQHYNVGVESDKQIQASKHNNEDIFYKVKTLF